MKMLVFEAGKYKFYYYPGQEIVLTQVYKSSHSHGSEISIVYTKDQLQALISLIEKLQLISPTKNAIEMLAGELLYET